METKSRYQAILELEAQKRDIIQKRDNLKDVLRHKEKSLRDNKRCIEDEEEELEIFKKSIPEQEATYNELLSGIEQSLERLGNMNSK